MTQAASPPRFKHMNDEEATALGNEMLAGKHVPTEGMEPDVHKALLEASGKSDKIAKETSALQGRIDALNREQVLTNGEMRALMTLLLNAEDARRGKAKQAKEAQTKECAHPSFGDDGRCVNCQMKVKSLVNENN